MAVDIGTDLRLVPYGRLLKPICFRHNMRSFMTIASLLLLRLAGRLLRDSLALLIVHETVCT